MDKVAPQFAEVADLLAAYGDTDLLCYRATGPQELIAPAGRRLGPAAGLGRDGLERAADRHRRASCTSPSRPASLARLHALIAALTPFQTCRLA